MLFKKKFLRIFSFLLCSFFCAFVCLLSMNEKKLPDNNLKQDIVNLQKKLQAISKKLKDSDSDSDSDSGGGGDSGTKKRKQKTELLDQLIFDKNEIKYPSKNKTKAEVDLKYCNSDYYESFIKVIKKTPIKELHLKFSPSNKSLKDDYSKILTTLSSLCNELVTINTIEVTLGEDTTDRKKLIDNLFISSDLYETIINKLDNFTIHFYDDSSDHGGEGSFSSRKIDSNKFYFSFNLEYLGLMDSHLNFIFKVLDKFHEKIKQLDLILCTNYIKSEGAKILSKLLKKAENLEDLNLNLNGIAPITVDNTMQIHSYDSHNYNAIGVEGVCNIFQSLSTLKNLKNLNINLDNNKIDFPISKKEKLNNFINEIKIRVAENVSDKIKQKKNELMGKIFLKKTKKKETNDNYQIYVDNFLKSNSSVQTIDKVTDDNFDDILDKKKDPILEDFEQYSKETLLKRISIDYEKEKQTKTYFDTFCKNLENITCEKFNINFTRNKINLEWASKLFSSLANINKCQIFDICLSNIESTNDDNFTTHFNSFSKSIANMKQNHKTLPQLTLNLHLLDEKNLFNIFEILKKEQNKNLELTFIINLNLDNYNEERLKNELSNLMTLIKNHKIYKPKTFSIDSNRNKRHNRGKDLQYLFKLDFEKIGNLNISILMSKKRFDADVTIEKLESYIGTKMLKERSNKYNLSEENQKFSYLDACLLYITSVTTIIINNIKILKDIINHLSISFDESPHSQISNDYIIKIVKNIVISCRQDDDILNQIDIKTTLSHLSHSPKLQNMFKNLEEMFLNIKKSLLGIQILEEEVDNFLDNY
jgi:hypothetical protein